MIPCRWIVVYFVLPSIFTLFVAPVLLAMLVFSSQTRYVLAFLASAWTTPLVIWVALWIAKEKKKQVPV